MPVSKDVRVTSMIQRTTIFTESSSSFGSIIENWYEKVEKMISIPDNEKNKLRIFRSLRDCKFLTVLKVQGVCLGSVQ